MSSAMEVDVEETDPVIAEYDIFITPQLKEQLLLLQYPTRARDAPYDFHHRALPQELRVKPKSGFVEVDIGVSTDANFDRIKGVQWGQALKHAKDSKAKGFGLSSGFGKGNEDSMKVLVAGEGRRKDGEAEAERMLGEFDARKDRGSVLEKQTLGGQIRRPEQDRPYHMVGTFKGNELHLTEITGIVQMRPQFHHIDAQAAITRTSLSRTGPAGKSAQAKPAQPITNAQIQASRNKASTETDNTIASSYEATNKFLEDAADERWKRLYYRDEMEEDAFKLFEEKMVLKTEGEEVKDLRSDWGVERYLDAIRSGGPIEEEKLRKKAGPPARKKVVKKGDAGATAGPSRR